MKEHPILFSAPMVKAILEGRKTMTRRAVKGLPSDAFEVGYWDQKGAPHRAASGLYWHQPAEEGTSFSTRMMACPYGQPGDRLWVRETFCIESSDDYSLSESRHPKDGRPIQTGLTDGGDGGYDRWEVPWYRATDGEPNIVPDDLPDSEDDRTRWKPSIFMPRWASRITLEVTEVRVERLQDISPEDILAEGVDNGSSNPSMGERWANMQRMAWTELWDSINGKREGFDWTSNPWVWVVSFKRVQ